MKLRRLIIGVVVVILVWVISQSAGINIPSGVEQTAEVVFIPDGDTIHVMIDDTRESVRIIGIDTPEIDYQDGQHECLGVEARDYLIDILQGNHVVLESDVRQADTDRYGRLLRHVMYDAVNIGLHMIEKGYAQEVTFDGAYRYQEVYQQAENRAQTQEQGIWSTIICN